MSPLPAPLKKAAYAAFFNGLKRANKSLKIYYKRSVEKHMHKTSAFTLIELSVVLVIIGLIVGGVLVGRDLIEAARLRNLIAQIEKYQTAVHTFESKYTYLPGDIPPAEASKYGLFALTGALAGATNNGDANKQINLEDPTVSCGELLLFWRHLSDANLVNGVYGVGSNGSGAVAAIDPALNRASGNIHMDNLQFVFPPTGFNQTFVSAFWENSPTWNGRNVFHVANIGEMYTSCSQYVIPANNFTPRQAYSIDTKLDDGFPEKGIVIYSGLNFASNVGYNDSWASTATSGYCTYGGSGATDTAALYNMQYPDLSACLNMTFMFQ